MESFTFLEGLLPHSRTHSEGAMHRLTGAHLLGSGDVRDGRFGKIALQVQISALDIEDNVLDIQPFKLYRLQVDIPSTISMQFLNLDRPFKFDMDKPNLDLKRCVQWKLDVAISGIELRPNEQFALYYTIGRA